MKEINTMNNNDFRTQIVAYIRDQAKPVDKFSHQARLYALTLEVGAGQTYDDDVVFAAAWLHDLGVFVGHRPENLEDLIKWDHVAYATGQTPPLLQRFAFPEEKIPAVLEAIRGHMPSNQPKTMEGIIVRDADILEQLGATAILRNVCKIGRDTRFQTFPDVLRLLQKSVDTLPGQLRLPTSQQLAEPRIQALRAFLDGASAEGCGPLECGDTSPLLAAPEL
jgi:uncharacterized protein